MEVPTIISFCSLPLRIGTIIMGLANSGFSFFLSILLLSYGIAIKEAGVYPGSLGTSSKDEGPMVQIVATILIMMSALHFAKLILDLIFVVGVVKDIRAIILRFNIFWLIFLVLYTLAFLKTIFHMNAVQVISQILFLGQYFYYLIVSLSYVRYLEEDESLA